MAGNFESTLSLQMEADTKDVRAQLAQVSTEFASLSKSVQQINVSLVGLTPATQEFLKNLQAVSASAQDTRAGMAGMVSVDVSKAFTASQEATKGFESDLSRLGKAAQTSGDSLGSVGAQTQGGTRDLEAFRGSVSSTSIDMESLKASLAEMVAAQREQTAAMREMVQSMNSVKEGIAAAANSGNSWTETIKNWVIIGKFGLDIWDRLTGKSDEAKKAIDENTKSIKEHTKALKGQSDAVVEQVSKLEQLSAAYEATKAAVSTARDSSEDFAFALADSLEANLKKASASLQKFSSDVDDAFEKLVNNYQQSEGIIYAWYDTFHKETEKNKTDVKTWSDSIKDAWENWINSFDNERTKYPTLFAPLTEAERTFLEEHIATWEKTSKVTEDYAEKFGTEITPRILHYWLQMRTGIQGEMFQMAQLAAAGGKSFSELADQIKDKFGNELTGGLMRSFATMSEQIYGDLRAVGKDIQYVIPLKEQLAKAGNIDAAQTLAITQQYNKDLATQWKQAETLAVKMLSLTDAKIKDAAAALNSAKATQEKARADLEAAEAAGKSAKETAGLKKAFEDAYNATEKVMSEYNEQAQKIYNKTQEIIKGGNNAAEELKKENDALKTFAESAATTLGISAGKMAGFIQTLYQGNSQMKADLPVVTAQLTAQQAAMNNFRQQVASGAYTTGEAVIAAAKSTAEGLGGTLEDQKKFSLDALKAVVADQKAIVDAQNKAVQDSVKNMQAEVSAGFAAMKGWYKDYYDAANTEIQRNKSEWNTALTANGNDVRLAQHEFDTYANSIKEKSDFMATNMQSDFIKIRAAIQSAIDRNDLQTAEALKKGFADFAQNSVQEFKNLRNEALSTYQSLQAKQAALIDQMAQKETELAKTREATSQQAFNAVEGIEGRTMTEFELYLRTIQNINQTRAESDRLQAQGDAESLTRAKELNNNMLSMAQQLKSVKLSAYDAMSDADKAEYQDQVDYLERIVARNEEQEAQYQRLLALKQKTVAVLSTQQAQQDALNVASYANTKNAEIDIKLQEDQNKKEAEQKEIMSQQVDAMYKLTTGLNSFTKFAETQVNFALNTDDAQKKVEALTQQRTMVVDVGVDNAKSVLDQLTAPRTIPINFKFEDTGAIRIEPIARFSKGGFMPGYGGGDRNVIAVEDGEFIMNKDAVRHWGLAFMEAVNRSDMMTKKQFSTGGFVAPSYDYVTRALYAGTKRIRGFSDGGLVTSSNSGDIMQAIERLGGIVTDLIETTGGQSDSLQSGIESFAQTINRAGQMLNGVAKRMDTSAGKLESTLNTPFHVDVEVDANGKGSAKAGSWGG